MKNLTITAIAATLALGLVSARAQTDLTFDFAANSGSSLQFKGGLNPSFSFTDSASADETQFHISDEVGGTGSAVGLLGTITPITGTAFDFSSITTTPLPGGGQIQTASVSPSGILTILDGTGHDLTGTVDLGTITTVDKTFGGISDDSLSINLTDLSYNGSNADLEELVSKSGTLDISFQFTSPENLTSLSTLASFITSYSGTFEVDVPEPSTWAMMLGGMGVMLVAMRFRRSAKA